MKIPFLIGNGIESLTCAQDAAFNRDFRKTLQRGICHITNGGDAGALRATLRGDEARLPHGKR